LAALAHGPHVRTAEPDRGIEPTPAVAAWLVEARIVERQQLGELGEAPVVRAAEPEPAALAVGLVPIERLLAVARRPFEAGACVADGTVGDGNEGRRGSALTRDGRREQHRDEPAIAECQAALAGLRTRSGHSRRTHVPWP